MLKLNQLITKSTRSVVAANSVAATVNIKLKRTIEDEITSRPLYMDAQATTPVDPRVQDKMQPYLVSYYGNPHSSSHAYGWQADQTVENSRQQIADIIGAKNSSEIILTSGATESNNMVIKGVTNFYKARGKRHIIVSQIEHKCVLDSARHLQHTDPDVDVTYLQVGKDGRICMKELEHEIRPDTLLVSIMAVNNEIGSIQPLKEIGELCRKNKIFFHTDAAQAVGKIPVDVDDMKIDLLSISGHKLYGPKGVGALYVRRKPRVRLEALFSGGGQERGMRSGTLAPFLVVGLGEACELAGKEMEYDTEYITRLSNRLIDGIQEKCEMVTINGSDNLEHRYAGCVNLSFAGIEGESLLLHLNDIALSSGSACTSASLEPSYVLRACGQSEDLAHSSIRFGINRFTTEEEIDFTINKITHVVDYLREMSPIWDMIQEGVDLSQIEWKVSDHQEQGLH